MTRRAPSAELLAQRMGMDGAAAVTTMPSHGAPASSPRLPSASRISTVPASVGREGIDARASQRR